jgi:hypothetical protein
VDTACSLGLSATSQQYFSLRTIKPPATNQQYFSLRTISTSHQPNEQAEPRIVWDTVALFVLLISHQPAVLFSYNKPATSDQLTVFFSQNKSAPAIIQQPNEQAGC